MDSFRLERLDLLKIDAEGHEYEILKGASKSISRGVIDIVQFEFSEHTAHRRQFVRDFQELLPGYELCRLWPDGSLEALAKLQLYGREIFLHQNIVAIRNGSDKAALISG